MHFFLLNILLILFSCNDGKLHKAEYNHPIEDPVKAYLVGVYKKEIIPEKNEIIIHNSTETIEENSSLDVGISFKNTNDISDEQVIYISSNNPIIRVEPNILVFNRNSATNNQIIKVKTELLPTIAPEKIELSLKSSGIDEKIVIFSVVDSIGQKILIEGDGESNEEEEDSIRVKLRKKPISENYIISITPNDSFVSLVNTKVEFTQTDYNEFKTVKYTVNDNYNDYHSYKITLNNENITADYLFNVKDNDHQYRSCSGENSNDGFTPALTIVNNEVITVSKKYQPETNTDYYLNFYKCDLNGDSCSNTRYRDISFIDLNLFSAIPFQPKISHESSYDYFQIPISLSTGELNLFNCNNTLTDCRLAYSVSSGIFPKYITADKKLYIMSGNEPIVLLHIDNQNNIIDGNNYGEIVSEVYHNY
ncbi:MAG: hypothetical protein KDK45_14765, partial [Leptospiraceae bacterium]|nr:hypothetical protein [Leptospiraceae bacterium]